MIFLSAQPDEHFFLWQLELQMFNLHNNGISSDDIHILIGYNFNSGLRPYVAKFIDRWHHKARFFCYPDKRTGSKYRSSIRPHLIKQHLKAFPHLAGERIFYHDSDVLFNNIDRILSIPQEADWLLSDTRSYLSSEYILSASNEALFLEMCAIVGISPSKVKDHDAHAGGAQYIFSNTSFDFWDKVEQDCETLYTAMATYNNHLFIKDYARLEGVRSKVRGIQAWCADMWAVLWNAILFDYSVKIHPALDFCWPKNPIGNWQSSSLLHYSGVLQRDKPQAFHKSSFYYVAPYFEDFSEIDPSTCSKVIIDHIDQFKSSWQKIDLQDTLVCIPILDEEPSVIENARIIVKYIQRHFDARCFILDRTETRRLQDHFDKGIYVPIGAEEQALVNFLSQQGSLYAILYEPTAIVPVNTIMEIVNILKKQEQDGFFIKEHGLIVDKITKDIFTKILDDEFLFLNKGKFIVDEEADAVPLMLFNRKILNDRYDSSRTYKSNIAACCTRYEPVGSNDENYIFTLS